MPIKSRISSIMGQIESEHPELFVLEFRKIAESDIVYTLASTNVDQSTPNLVKMYMTKKRPKSVELTGCRNDRVPKRLGTILANFK